MMLKYSRTEFRPGSDGPAQDSARRRNAPDARETLIRIVLPALLIYAALCLASTRRALYTAGQEEASLRARLEAVEQENRTLNQRLSEGWSSEELEALARERLGLVLPGDRIFRFTSDAQEEP
jgi:cell division protein FtsB